VRLLPGGLGVPARSMGFARTATAGEPTCSALQTPARSLHALAMNP
jgi:hypothetical protein